MDYHLSDCRIHCSHSRHSPLYRNHTYRDHIHYNLHYHSHIRRSRFDHNLPHHSHFDHSYTHRNDALLRQCAQRRRQPPLQRQNRHYKPDRYPQYHYSRQCLLRPPPHLLLLDFHTH